MKLRFPLLLLVASAVAAATLGACGSDDNTGTTGMCGNGVLDPNEPCDGMLLSPTATCSMQTMGAKPLGTVVCTPQCTLNNLGCMSMAMGTGGVTGGSGSPPVSTGGAPVMMMPTGTGGMMMGSGGTTGTGGMMDPGTGGGPDGSGGDMSGGGTGGGP